MRNGLNEPRDDFIGTRVGGRRRGYFFVDIFTCLCSNEAIERLFFHYRFIRRGVAALNPADSFFSARVPRKSLSIYDLRFTMYDLGNSRALRGGGGANAKRNFESRDRGWLERGGGRRGLPMYDVRCTIAKFARVARRRRSGGKAEF